MNENPVWIKTLTGFFIKKSDLGTPKSLFQCYSKTLILASFRFRFLHHNGFAI